MRKRLEFETSKLLVTLLVLTKMWDNLHTCFLAKSFCICLFVGHIFIIFSDSHSFIFFSFVDFVSTNNRKFTKMELSHFTVSQLTQICEAIESRIKDLSTEMGGLNEENERHSSDKDGLKMTVVNFEELALRVMKPWVNSMPQSDEMTRVMLLNWVWMLRKKRNDLKDKAIFFLLIILIK